VIMQAGGGTMFHSLGIFFATFTYSLAALMWTGLDDQDQATAHFEDRQGLGLTRRRPPVPPSSAHSPPRRDFIGP